MSSKLGEPLQKRPGLGLGPKSDYNSLNLNRWRLGLKVIEMLLAKLGEVGPRRKSLTGSNEVDPKSKIGERHHSRGCQSGEFDF